MKTLSPLIERIEANIMGSDLLHAPSRACKHALPGNGRPRAGFACRRASTIAVFNPPRGWA